MKADDPKSTPATTTAPPPAAAEPAAGSVSEGLGDLLDRVRESPVWNPKVVGIVLAVALAGGLWWFLASQNRTASSQLWAGLERATGPTEIDQFVKDYPDTPAGRVARMEQARNLFGPEGIGRLASRDAEPRKKAVENVEKARAEFLTLADAFAGDLAMTAEALKGAAEAELALVGIPKADNKAEFRGTVDKAVELYQRLAKVAGDANPVGQWAAKRADELAKNKDDIRRVAVSLNDAVSPAAGPPDIKLPGGLGTVTPTPSTSGVTPPTGPIPTPTPPTGAVPAPPKAATPATGPQPPAASPATKTVDPAVAPLKPGGGTTPGGK